MAIDQEVSVEEFDEIISEGKELHLENFSNNNYNLRAVYKTWKTRVRDLIRRAFGGINSEYYQSLDYILNQKNPKLEETMSLDLLQRAKKDYQNSLTREKSSRRNLEQDVTKTKKTESIVFVSHSSKDEKLIRLVELAFDDRDIKPYFAKNRIEGKNPVEKIVEAISNSKYFFALVTSNVVNDTHTRDWVNFEIGVAKAFNKKIFVWIDKGVSADKKYPQLLENVTDYNSFDCQSDKDCHNVVIAIRNQALDHLIEPKNRIEQTLRIETPISMDEAQKIAEQFILTKKPEYTKIDISSSENNAGDWIIKGRISRSGNKSYGSENWSITIKGKEIVSYEFKPGFSFAIG
jgi:hypothetical protein